LFACQISLTGEPGSKRTINYTDIPDADVLALEAAMFSLGPYINSNPPPRQPETSPRIKTLTLEGTLMELSDKQGNKHKNPKPFFGPVTVPWHDVPSYSAAYIWDLVQQTLTPFARYLVPVLLVILALLVSTGSAQAQNIIGFQPPPVAFQPNPIMIQPGPIFIQQSPPTLIENGNGFHGRSPYEPRPGYEGFAPGGVFLRIQVNRGGVLRGGSGFFRGGGRGGC
jgi:hypothetical protein